MRLLYASLTGSFFLLLLLTPVAQGQQVADIDNCVDALNREVAKEHRIFRTVLFGSSKAKESPIGTVVYEEDGSGWYKINATEWKSADEGFEGVTHYNSLIDQRSEVTRALGKADRKGIFETKGVTTSELLPAIGSSLRTFQCKLYQFCNVVNASKAGEGEDPFPATPQYPGCVAEERDSIPACHINKRRPIGEDILIFQNCEKAVQQLLEQEAEVVNLVIQYDAAYRTLLQLAGSMDLFLQEMHWSTSTTLQQATDLVGILGRIPCYITTCDAFPPPKKQ